MAWTGETTIRHAGFRGFATFRVVCNLGCVLMWKPWLFAIGIEKFKRGGAIYLGPFAVVFGPVYPERSIFSRSQ